MSARNFTITLTVPANDQFDMTDGDYTLADFQQMIDENLTPSGWLDFAGVQIKVTDISITEVKS